MILFLLIAFAAGLGWYIGKNPDELNVVVLQGIKWFCILSSLIWMGGLFNLLAVFILYQCFFTAARNLAQGKEAWYVDEDTWLGEIVTKYWGVSGGKTLFIAELIIAFLIILL